MSSLRDKFWRPVFYGYLANALASLSLIYHNSQLDEFLIGFFFLALAPAIGAYLIYSCWRYTTSKLAGLGYTTIQILLLILVFYVQISMFSRFSYEGYSRNILFLSGSLFFPWLAYAIFLNCFFGFTLGIIRLFSKKTDLERN